MPPITSENVVEQLLGQIPEFRPIYDQEVEIDQAVGINTGMVNLDRLLSSLAMFAIHACDRDQSPELPGPQFDDLDDLLCRIAAFAERAANSEDSEVVQLIRDSFTYTLYLMGFHYDKIKAYLGSQTRRMLVDRELKNPKWLQEPEWDDGGEDDD